MIMTFKNSDMFDPSNVPASETLRPDASKLQPPDKGTSPLLGAHEVGGQQLSASEMAILVQIVHTCIKSKWNTLGGGAAAEKTEIKMRLRFNPDGTLAAPPHLMNPSNTPYFLAATESAVRAVKQCEPLPLPSPKYDVWKEMTLTFRPSDVPAKDAQHPEPSKIITEPRESPAQILATTSGASTNGFVAVLSSQKSRMDALKAFTDLQQTYHDVLASKTPDVQEANLGEKGVWYRAVVGPPGSLDAAAALCTQLKAVGYQGCWVVAR
jgi:SPOR domain